MSSVSTTESSVTDSGLFTRRATGLVREVSPLSAAVFNTATAAPGLFAAISAFFAFSIFPHANVLLTMVLTVPISLLVGVTFAILQRIVPRSGGDYVIVSRLLAPWAGVASTFLLGAGAIIGMGFFCYSFVTVGLQPALAIIGTVSGSHGLISASESLSHKGWTTLFSLVFLAGGLAIVAIPMRTTMRIQNLSILIAAVGFVLGLLFLWFVPKSTFVSHFDHYAGAGAYQKLTAAGGKASYNVHDTVYAIGTIAAFTIYQWWSTYFAGEIKQLSRRSLFTMLAPTGIYFFALFLMVGTLVAKFDHGFLVAANTGNEAYTLTAPPFWQFLASISSGNTVVAVILAVTFVFWLPLLAIVQLLPPIRSAFAMAFDGLLPRATAKVSQRSRVPLVAVALVGLLSLVATLWAVLNTSSFSSAALYSATFTNTTMLIMCIAAILLPYRSRELWAASPLSGRIAGVPILSVLGAVTFCAVAFTSFLYLQPELGIPSAGAALRNVAIVAGAGLVLYVVAMRVQRTRGVDVTLNYKEIPPE
jgi:APA family basic amino acid/polyamine antiporter